MIYNINMKKKIIYFVLIVLVILGTSLAVQVMMSLPRLWNYAGSPDSWLGFWGSLIGACLGVGGAYYVMNAQRESERNQYYEEKIDNTFFNLIDLFQSIREVAKEEVTPAYKKIEKARDELVAHKQETEKLKKFEQRKSFFRQEINICKGKIEEFSPNTDLDKFFKNKLEEIMLTIEEAKFEDLETKLNGWGEEINRLYQDDLMSNIMNEIEAIDREVECYVPEFKYDEIFDIVNGILSKEHVNTGNYFRIFYRIVKYIMKASIDLEKKKEYLGILRALLSSEELLVIFYNAFYSTRGKGLEQQLSKEKTGFFADETDLELVNFSKGIDLPFFRYDDLIFDKNDLDKIVYLTDFKGDVGLSETKKALN